MSHTQTDFSDKPSSLEDTQLQHGEVTDNAPAFSAQEESRLYRKIDLRLLPILSLMYLLAVMDRTNIGNATLEGLITQLKLSSKEYSVALFMFFIPYCLCEPMSNLLVKYFKPSRYLPTLSFLWGIVMALMGLVKSYPQLVGARICLGVVEAGLFPGVVYFLTFWYPRYMLQYRIGLFFGAATVAGAFSGLLAYAISFMSGTHGLEGWSWIFIIEGIATVAVAILAALVLHGCDTPEAASFLTPEEREFISYRRKSGLGTVSEDESYKREYIIKAAIDWQVWIHALIFFSIVCPLGASVLFLPSIINGFGYSRAMSQLLTVPVYLFATIVLLSFAYCSDKYRRRGLSILVPQCMALVGFIINIADTPRGAKLFGMFLSIAGTYGSVPGTIAWLGCNLAPTYKRGVGIALQVGMGGFSSIISTIMYPPKDAPKYTRGHATAIGFLVMGVITVSSTTLIYQHINASRDAMAREGGHKHSDEELARMGDRAPSFRYLI